MYDGSVKAARQSEGPSHPFMMRKAPPKRLGTPFIIDLENVARPNIMFHRPPKKVHSQIDEDYYEYHENSIMNSGETTLFNSLTVENHRLDDPHGDSDHPQSLRLSQDLEGSLSRQRRLDSSVIGHDGNYESNVRFERQEDLPMERGKNDQQSSGQLMPRGRWAGFRRYVKGTLNEFN